MFGNKKLHTLLLVEDDEHNRALYKKIFDEAGFDITILEHADPPFLEVVGEMQPDVIIMDLMIAKEEGVTEREGFEAIEALKEDAQTAHIPIFVMSSFTNENRVIRAKQLGVVDYINKSGFNPVEVPDIISEFLKNPKKYTPVHSLMR